MRWTDAASLLAITLLTGACSTAPVRIPADSVDDLAKPAGAGPGCAALGSFVDARPNAELGTLGAREFVYEDYPGWLRRQLAHRLGGDGPQLRIELLRAYLETNRSTLSFTVVLRSQVPGQPARVHRGSDTRINWFNSNGELGSFIERASERAITELVAQADVNCAAPRTGAQ